MIEPSLAAELLLKLLPIYLLIGLGVFAKKLEIEIKSISRLLLYFETPGVFFHNTNSANLSWHFLLFPLSFFLSACCIALIIFALGQKQNPKSPNNALLAFISASSNSGYFGIPATILLFGESLGGIATILSFGHVLYEYSLGIYLLQREHYGLKQAVKKIFSLPGVYAFLLGITTNFLGYKSPAFLIPFWKNFYGLYSILGMMAIGMALKTSSTVSPSKSLIGHSISNMQKKDLILGLMARFVLWPIFIGIILCIPHFVPHDLRPIFILYAFIPFGANGIAFAKEFNLNVSFAAKIIFIGTLISSLVIPLFLPLFLAN